MGRIQDQVHGRFKILSGASIEELTANAARFVNEGGLAPKSIGVEFLEGARRFVLTLGYRDDEPGYAVAFEHHDLGRADSLDDLSAIEERLTAVAARAPGILCHELYINSEHEFFLVIMRLAD